MGADQGLTRLFYDGDCGFCRGAVRFVARRDPAGRIRFAPLGGATFDRLLPETSRRRLPDSLVALTSEGQVLLRSKAVIHLLGQIASPWPLVGAVLARIPSGLSDAAYRLFARLRPSSQTCSSVETAWADRFDP